MKNNHSIAFIGCGSMALSIVQGLLETGYPKEKLWATSRRKERVTYFNEILEINASSNNIEAAQVADVIVLAVKPQQMQAVARELACVVQENKPLIISVAVGVSAGMLEKWLGGEVALVRSMPNTPALIGAGASGLFANNLVSEEQKTVAESLHRAVGIAVWVEDEILINAVASVSGSGPAYIFYVIEAMQNAGIKLGLSAEQAKLLALQTAIGASRLALESDEGVASLRRKVTSPNGTTERAIKVFDEMALSATFEKAMRAASDRAKVLTDLLDTKINQPKAEK